MLCSFTIRTLASVQIRTLSSFATHHQAPPRLQACAATRTLLRIHVLWDGSNRSNWYCPSESCPSRANRALDALSCHAPAVRMDGHAHSPWLVHMREAMCVHMHYRVSDNIRYNPMHVSCRFRSCLFDCASHCFFIELILRLYLSLFVWICNMVGLIVSCGVPMFMK